MRERVSQMIHLYGHFRRHSFDQKEERKMGRGGREREREKGKERKIVRCRFKVIARDFCANFTSPVKELFPFTPRRLNNFSTSFIVPVPPPLPSFLPSNRYCGICRDMTNSGINSIFFAFCAAAKFFFFFFFFLLLPAFFLQTFFVALGEI